MKNLTFYTFFVIIFLAFFILSCDKNAEISETPNEITFWHFWSEPYQRTEMNKLIAEFEAENYCKVKVSELSWGDGKAKLLTAFSSNTAPDVLELGSDWVAQFSSAGVLLELSKEEMQIDNYIEFSKAPCFWEQKLYALPWVVDTRVLFYNKSLLNQAGLASDPPESYDEMAIMAEKINQIEGVYGFGATGSDEHRLYKKIVPMFWTYGGEVFNGDKLVLDSPDNIKALEKYAELARYGMLETQRQLDAAFVKGSIGLWVSGGWLLKKIENENPTLDFGVALMPGDGEKKGYSFAGGEYFAINNKTKKSELSKKFIKFLTSGANAIKFCKVINEAGFPADKQYFKDPFYNDFPNRLVFAEQLNYSKMTPVHPKWLDVEKIIENKTVEVLYGKIEPAEALKNAQAEAESIIR